MTIEEANKVVLIDSSGNYIVPVIDPLDALPAQDDKAGKFLKTDGTQASWEDIPPATMLNIKKDLLSIKPNKILGFNATGDKMLNVPFPDGTKGSFVDIPDFNMYNFTAGTYNLAINQEGQVFTSNIVGAETLIQSDGTLFNFSSSNYYKKEITLDTDKAKDFPITWDITTGSDISTEQYIFSIATWCMQLSIVSGKLHLYLGSGSAWDIANGTAGTSILSANVHYKAELDYDGINYTLKLYDYSNGAVPTITEELVIPSGTMISTGERTLQVGVNSNKQLAFRGKIDPRSSFIGNIWLGESILDEKNIATITVDASNITKAIALYSAESTAPLEDVNIFTGDTYHEVLEKPSNALDMVPFTFVNVNYNTSVTVQANTNYTFNKDGIVNLSSAGSIQLTTDGQTYVIYGNTWNVEAGQTINCTTAGRFYYYEGQ